MMSRLRTAWNDEGGALSFEWTLIVTLLVIGVVGGLAAARDAIIDELGDVAQGMLAVDQSMTIDAPLAVSVHTFDPSSASDSSFTDAMTYSDCARQDSLPGQPQIADDFDS